ncbi:MAG TPA: hypothetical protein VG298_11620 [Acidimicrobiales bacterium]|nr:hypothetical protein [Acidimicrobiales bacterium]
MAYPESRPEVVVAVLGPVEVRGAAQPFSRPAARDLVVYLALHRPGARNDVWAAALWPDRAVAASTLHSTASVARRSLGRSASGDDHLPRSGRQLRLAESVGTDLERFTHLSGDPDPARWVEAMRLIRGRPLDGVGLADWAVLDGTQAAVETAVVDLALRGAAHFVDRGLGEEAEWMIRQGLRVTPYDERLYRALLWAAEAKGDRVGLRSAMAELLCVAGEGGAGPGSIHPRTVALYRDLARGEVPAARGDLIRL